MQCHHLAKCTAKTSFSPTFYLSPILVHRWWHVWKILQTYNLCYHFMVLCLPLCSVAELTCWLRWSALKHLKNPVDISTVIVVIRGAFFSQNYKIVNVIIRTVNYKKRTKLTAQNCIYWNSTCFFIAFKLLSNKTLSM